MTGRRAASVCAGAGGVLAVEECGDCTCAVAADGVAAGELVPGNAAALAGISSPVCPHAASASAARAASGTALTHRSYAYFARCVHPANPARAGRLYELVWRSPAAGIECVQSKRRPSKRSRVSTHTVVSLRAARRLVQHHHDKEVPCSEHGTTRKPGCRARGAVAIVASTAALGGVAGFAGPRTGIRHGQGRGRRNIDRRQRDDHLDVQPDDRAAGKTAGRTRHDRAGRARRSGGQHAGRSKRSKR